MGPPRSSKKRPQANRACRCVKEILAVVEAARSVARTTQRDIPISADSGACLFGFSSREEAHDHSNDDEHRDANSNIERRE
jgi:hypothetical protein